MTVAWAHLHLPRLSSGETPDVISVKIPGQKIRYSSWITLSGVTFRVSEAGRQRCLRDRVRNVHAWVVGERLREGSGDVKWLLDTRTWRQALYDPFKGGAFVDAETFEPVHSAAEAILIGKFVWYKV